MKTLTKSGNEFQKVIVHTGYKFSAFFLTESFLFVFKEFTNFIENFISNISKCSSALRKTLKIGKDKNFLKKREKNNRKQAKK